MELKSKKVKRKFTQEFRNEAIILASNVGYSQAARELGLSESLVRVWKKRKDLLKSPGQASAFSQNSKTRTYEELEAELRRVTKENGYLLEINKVLKKSTAIFSLNQLEGIK